MNEAPGSRGNKMPSAKEEKKTISFLLFGGRPYLRKGGLPGPGGEVPAGGEGPRGVESRLPKESRQAGRIQGALPSEAGPARAKPGQGNLSLSLRIGRRGWVSRGSVAPRHQKGKRSSSLRCHGDDDDDEEGWGRELRPPRGSSVNFMAD